MKIKEILEEIKKLENYCSVNKATTKTFNKTKEIFGEMPEDLQEFYKVYNGGIFFLQDFACVDEQDGYSFDELNDSEYKEMYYVPENIIVFGKTNYGACVGYDTKNKNIILIDPEDDEENWITWNSFTKYLEEFLIDSKQMIEEEVLEPLR